MGVVHAKEMIKHALHADDNRRHYEQSSTIVLRRRRQFCMQCPAIGCQMLCWCRCHDDDSLPFLFATEIKAAAQAMITGGTWALTMSNKQSLEQLFRDPSVLLALADIIAYAAAFQCPSIDIFMKAVHDNARR
jgi:hypothetical protein